MSYLPAELRVFLTGAVTLPRDVREKIAKIYVSSEQVDSLEWEFGFIHGQVADYNLEICTYMNPRLLIARDQVNPVTNEGIMRHTSDKETFAYFYERFPDFYYSLGILDNYLTFGNLEFYMFVEEVIIRPQGLDYDGELALPMLAYKGKLDEIVYLCQNKLIVSDYDMYVFVITKAACNGHLNIIRYFHETYRSRNPDWAHLPPFSKETMDKAAEGGYMEIVRYLYDIWQPLGEPGCTRDAIDDAAIKGHFDVIRFIYENIWQPRGEPGCTEHAINNAARIGRVDIVHYLYENIWQPRGKPGCTVGAIHFSAYEGKLDSVRYLYEEIWKPRGEPGCGKEAIHYASLRGHLEVVRYVYEEIWQPRGERGCSRSIYKKAAENGHREIYNYIRRRIWRR